MIVTNVSRRTRLLVGFAGLFLAIAAWPTAAFGHASPIGSDPADGTVVGAAPERVTVTFSEPVSASSSGNQLLDAEGEPVESVITARDRELVFEPAETLADGSYIVAWRVVSADSHPVSGGFSFAVGAPSAQAIDVPMDAKQREVELLRIMAEAVRYAGLLAFVGIIWFAAVIAPSSLSRRDPARQRLGSVASGALAVATFAQVVLVPVSALRESGEGLARLWSGSTWDAVADSPVTASAALLILGGLFARVAWARDRSVVAATGAALALGSLVVVGHTRSHGPAWLVLGADLTHVAAAAIWWGGLIALIICSAVVPPLRAGRRAELIARFSTVAGIAVAALAVAGVVLYWRIAGSVTGLWESTYGRFVLAKVVLMVPLIIIAVWNRSRLLPRLAGKDARDAATMLTRLVRVEAAIIVVVLVATAALVTQAPPAPPVAETPVAREQVLDLLLDEQHRARIVITPARQGINAVQVTVRDSAGTVTKIDGDPTLSVTLRASDIGPFDRPLARTGPATWEATADLPMEGTWTFALSVPLTRFDTPVVTGTVEVP